MKKKIPITYTGSDTENLYVLGIRNDREIKLKVKEIGCHGPIRVDGVTEDSESYKDEVSLKEAAKRGELVNNTVYIINVDGTEKKYIYYNNELVPIGFSETPDTPENPEITSDVLKFGNSYETFDALKDAFDSGSLKSRTIYTVTDKGTIEQYICYDNKIVQISGGLNEIISGTDNEAENDVISSVEYITDGIIDYNLLELVNGDFRYKNHNELHTVICDMPSLVSGRQMFWGTSLTSFCGNLGSLEDGYGMFGRGCKLDESSIINIVDGIKVHDATHPKRISIGYNSALVSEEAKTNFNKEFASKGWSVTWLINGSLSI